MKDEQNPLSGILFHKIKAAGGFPLTQEDVLIKEGTSEGARRGWETRRGRAPVEQPKAEQRYMGGGHGAKTFVPPAGTKTRDGWDKCLALSPEERKKAVAGAVRAMEEAGQREHAEGWMAAWQTFGESTPEEVKGRLGGVKGDRILSEAEARAKGGEEGAVGAEMAQAERHIKFRGAAHVGNVNVKIVPRLQGEGFGVETTVDGDRRYPEEWMSLEEAQKFALEQLKNPRPARKIEEKPKAEKKPMAEGRPYKNVGDLAAEYKQRGIPRDRAWGQFIIDTKLSPKYRSEEVDAKDFYQAYDRA